MKILLTGGGTAGHVSGNMALVPELKKHGFQIEYIGRAKGIEKNIVTADKDILYHSIPAGRLNRSFTWQNFTDIFRTIKGISSASKIIKQTKPDLVFSKGGFVSVPVVIAASLHKIPTIIHESDYTPGLANKISAKFADKICTTFPETVKYFNSDKAHCTGSPIRNEILCGNKNKGLRLCGFTDQKPVIIVMGGSLGAEALNSAVRTSLSRLLVSYNVIHICGKGGTKPEFDGINGYKQFGYVTEELPHLLAAADIALSRAGSNAIFEFLALSIPMLLVPLPKGNSRGDQIINAQSFEKSGFAIKLDQELINNDILYTKLNELYKNKDSIKVNMQSSNLLNGTENILRIILDMTSNKTKDI